MTHPLRTAQWKKLRAQILKQQPLCQIRDPGCTGIATTVDHIIPRSVAPHLTMIPSNLRGACQHCNYTGNKRPDRQARPRPRALAFFKT